MANPLVAAMTGSSLDSPETEPLNVAADTEVDQPEGSDDNAATTTEEEPQVSQQPAAFSSGTPAASKAAIAQEMAQVWKARGWSDASIHGALANGLAESNLNPIAVDDQGTSHGLFQFHAGGELGPYMQFANQLGADPTNPKVQADYVAEAMDSRMPGYGRMVDPQAATDAFMTHFERPADQTLGIRYGHISEAQQLYNGTLPGQAGHVQLASAADDTFSDVGPTMPADNAAQASQSDQSWRPPPFEAAPQTGPHNYSSSVAVPVAPPSSAPATPPGPQKLGPYDTMSAAYQAKPADTSNYVLHQSADGWAWTPRSSLPQDGTSPYYSPPAASDTQFGASPAAKVMAPGSAATPEGHGIGSWLASTNFVRGMASGTARIGDLIGLGISKVEPWISAAANNAGTAPFADTTAVDLTNRYLASKGMKALSAGAQTTPPNTEGPAAGSLQYGKPDPTKLVNYPYDVAKPPQLGENFDYKSLGTQAVDALGLKTDMDPNGLFADMLYQAGNMVPWAVAGAPLAPALGAVPGVGSIPLLGRLLTSAASKFAANPATYAAGEALAGAGWGAGSGEAHDIYRGATDREGDWGDTLAEIAGGGAWNAVRMPLIAAGEHAAVSSAKGAIQGIVSGAAKKGVTAGWNAAKDALGSDASGSLPQQVGQAATDSYLSNALEQNLSAARQHVDALGTAAPGDSAAYLAQQSVAARDAVRAWLRGSRAEERQLWAPSVTTWRNAVGEEVPVQVSEAPVHGEDGQLYQNIQMPDGTQQQVLANQLTSSPGVNLQMPRNFDATKGLYGQLKNDLLSPNNLRDPKSFPLELDDAFNGQNGLQTVDTLGRGQDLRSRIGGLIDQEVAKGPGADAAKIGYLRQLQTSIRGDLENGAEGANPGEIDAYRRARAFSASRAQLSDSPEMLDFMSGRTPDEAALDKLLKQGPAGVSAADFVTQMAQQKYGSEGIMGATKDALRQKYADAVAPYGYVDLQAHDRFMQRYGGLLESPQFADVKQQLQDAGTAEQTLNSTAALGKPGGFRGTQAQQAIRDERADLYLNAPTKTVIDHLEGVQNPGQATANVLNSLAKDPTGQASLGFQHAVAMRATTDPLWLAAHPEITAAVDQVNPGFAARAAAFQNPRTVQGLTKIASDYISSVAGARIGHMMPGARHSGLVATGQGARGGREVFGNVINKLMGTSPEERANQIVGKWDQQVQNMSPEERAGMIMDGNASQSFGNIVGGMTRTLGDKALDAMRVYTVAPAWAASYGITDPNFASGTGQPGSASNPGGPPEMRGSANPAPWYEQLQYPQPGAARR